MGERSSEGQRLEVGAASLPSDAHRARNEDVWFSVPECGFFGVFDGMGGHTAAGVAARMAAEEVQDVLSPLAPDAEADAVADTIRDAFFSTDSAIRAEAQSRGDPRGMGTTAIVAVLRPPFAQASGGLRPAFAKAPAFPPLLAGVSAGGSAGLRPAFAQASGGLRPFDAETWSAIIGWAGDSRALLLPADSRTLQTLTLDDGVVRLHAASLAGARKVQAALGIAVDSKQLSLRERDFFLERHVILQAIGTSLRHVHIAEHTLGTDDVLLLVTDGVHDNLTDREIASITRHAPSAQEAAQRLVAAAQERSRDAEHFRAKPDDMTAVVVRLGA